jgi:hypothetical protein
MPHLPLGVPVAVAACGAGAGSGSVVTEAQRDGAWPAGLAGTGAWRALLRASGRAA